MKVYILLGTRPGFNPDVLGIYGTFEILKTACRDHRLAGENASQVAVLPRYQEYHYIEATIDKAAGIYTPGVVVL